MLKPTLLLDNLVQRLIELLLSFPRLPLWLAISMIIPPGWPSSYVYIGTIVVLSIIGWAGLARAIFVGKNRRLRAGGQSAGDERPTDHPPAYLAEHQQLPHRRRDAGAAGVHPG